MNLQTLKYFVSLSRTKSFTKAAEECFVSQPALSRSISELENKLGCSLVIRNSRVVELTEEGKIFALEAEKVLRQYNIMIEKVTNGIDKFKEPVKVGYIIYGHITVFNKKISQIPNRNLIEIHPIYDTLFNVWENLQSDEIDMAIVPEVCINYNNVNSFRLSKSKLYVVVPSKHELFNKDFIKFSHLKNQKFIGWDSEEVPLLIDAHSKICEENGFKPKFVAYGKKMGDVMTLSILHNALGFAAYDSTIVDQTEFRLKPILDSEEIFGLACIWKKTNRNPSLERLITMLEK